MCTLEGGEEEGVRRKIRWRGGGGRNGGKEERRERGKEGKRKGGKEGERQRQE